MRTCLYLMLLTILLALSGCGRKGDLYLPINEQTAEELNTTSELLDDAAQITDLTEAQKQEAAKQKRQSEADSEILSDDAQ